MLIRLVGRNLWDPLQTIRSYFNFLPLHFLFFLPITFLIILLSQSFFPPHFLLPSLAHPLSLSLPCRCLNLFQSYFITFTPFFPDCYPKFSLPFHLILSLVLYFCSAAFTHLLSPPRSSCLSPCTAFTHSCSWLIKTSQVPPTLSTLLNGNRQCRTAGQQGHERWQHPDNLHLPLSASLSASRRERQVALMSILLFFN